MARGKKSTKPTMKDKVSELSKQVKNLTKSSEVKYHDESQVSTETAFDSAAVSTLFDPAQGDGRTERVGDTANPYWIEIDGHLEHQTAANQVVRVTLIQSKQRFVPLSHSTGTATQTLYSQAGTVNAPHSPFYYDNKVHYKVLYDKVFTMGTSSDECRKFRIRRKIPYPVSYQAGATTATSGQIYLCFTSSQSNASNTGAYRQWESRVYFKD